MISGDSSMTSLVQKMLGRRWSPSETRRGSVRRRAVGPIVPAYQAPVTYMNICETDYFSMGVFLLRSGSSIPLHDHPGMHGVLKVLYGKVRINCFDRLDRPSPPGAQSSSQRLSVLRSTGEFTPESGPCVLSPDRDNIHQIDAVDGPTAFMDILARRMTRTTAETVTTTRSSPRRVRTRASRARRLRSGRSLSLRTSFAGQSRTPARGCTSDPRAVDVPLNPGHCELSLDSVNFKACS
ncbi:hypothetical protein WMY93_018027 [Mugilogobius chulae]|uniref:2-aminoethanethiol dioxygenase n=1 Tax=Mugilogobius chulae TaxID=88201 RepID=A0AAW0NIZ0_9GOBI